MIELSLLLKYKDYRKEIRLSNFNQININIKTIFKFNIIFFYGINDIYIKSYFFFLHLLCKIKELNMSTTRKNYLVANWKMNKDFQGARNILVELKNKLEKLFLDKPELSDTKIIIAPPFPFLIPATQNSAIEVAAQNCFKEDWGSFTGEVSVPMLKSLGVDFVIVGHSERRSIFKEDDILLREKVDKILEYGLIPIFCCGETLDTRNQGFHLSFVKRQISDVIFHLEEHNIKKVIIAYEPIWAIGTGKIPDRSDIQFMHRGIREHIKTNYGEIVSNQITILYGGSVNEKNSKSIFDCEDVDGGLVGGASLNGDSFVKIAEGFI